MVILSIVVLVILVALCLVVPWEWSPIDDPGHVLALHDRVSSLGPLLGTWTRIVDLFTVDRTWALFRPGYWLYAGAFYWLPISLAHVTRILLVFIVVGAPVVYFRRLRTSCVPMPFMILFIAAATSGLYLGIEFVSLQELTGAACIAVGLLFRKQSGRIILWTLAAWLKAPFAWMLIAYGVVHIDEAGLLERYVEKPTISMVVSTGIYGQRGSALNLVPAGQRMDMPDLLGALQISGRPVRCLVSDCEWRDLGRPSDFAELLQSPSWPG